MATVLNALAVDGGTPVYGGEWPRWPVWDEREEQALLGVLRSGAWGMVHGNAVAEFEQAWAAFQQAQYCVAVVNGSSALEVALRALDLEPGDEVIMPAYTFVATAAAALLAGALPVFADIDPDSFELDPAAVEAAVTQRTRAVIPVHIAGCPPDMDAILDLAKRHGLRVVEDAAQAHGAAWRGRRVGALGDLGTFSFQASKNLNAGEGGAIVTDDQTLFQRVWSLHNVGRTRTEQWRTSGWYQHDLLGFNYRLTAFQAALLLAQLTRLEDQMSRREQAAQLLDRELGAIPGIRPQARDPRVTAHAHHLYMLRYEAAAFGGRPRADFLAALRAEGVPCSPGYTEPLQRSPAVLQATETLCRRLDRQGESLRRPLPVTERISDEEGVWLSQSVLLADKGALRHIPEAVAKIQRAWG
ncbi:MAG TPA: DegT/DnrJ/EryC1/StrS family aminotransferase [Chloroflexota bacterium]|nr:DegT/DnrJ/EryC1/StrS family aminotransferase [Chloroflexota bacterium]